MRLSFRHRVFLGLLALGTLPLAAALVVVAVQARSGNPSQGARAAIDDIAESGRELLAVIDTTQLNGEVRSALAIHTEVLADRTALARRADVVSRLAAGAAGILALVVAVAVVAVSVVLARRWSAYVSAPIEELTASVRRIERREPVPQHTDGQDAPEFDALRQALLEMSEALEKVRRQEIEQERSQAFRETARQVAHEMRGPLTSVRLAIGQLDKAANASGEKSSVAVEVLQDETQRLEQMAREFSDFGRLPEGPVAPIDITEMIESVVGSTVPDKRPTRLEIQHGLKIHGHFEPLRRAFQNLIRNAVEACESSGIVIKASADYEASGNSVRVEVIDHGPGVPPDDRESVFNPYFTTKDLGTGLGLAIVKQTVVAHGGVITVTDADGGGAKFTVILPESP